MSSTETGLSQDRLKELFNFNSDTGIFVREKTISSNALKGQVCGCPSANGYLRFRVDGKLYYSHRLAWMYVFGYFPEADIDHANGDRSDNRISNLRLASRSENLQNRSRRGLAASGLMGAYWDKNLSKWYSKARCQKSGKQVHLGFFKSKIEAHEAYVKWKRENHKFQPEFRD